MKAWCLDLVVDVNGRRDVHVPGSREVDPPFLAWMEGGREQRPPSEIRQVGSSLNNPCALSVSFPPNLEAAHCLLPPGAWRQCAKG